MANYIKYALSDIYPEQELPGDIYLFVNNHYLKYKSKCDSITKIKYEDFLQRQVNHIYILSEEIATFEQWTAQQQKLSRDEIISRVGEENSDLVNSYFSVRSNALDFITKEITDATVKKTIEKTKEIIKLVRSKKNSDKLLGKMFLYGQSLADHGMNVANLSTFLAINIGYEQYSCLENIYTGALLHDFGKTRIDRKYLEDITSLDYQIAMKKHPTLGKTALIIDNGFSDEVLRIIIEHHEHCDGSGHPRGLTESRIFDLTKIVSIANAFDNLIQKDSSSASLEEKQKRAIKRLELEIKGGKIFDRKMLTKSLKALELIL